MAILLSTYPALTAKTPAFGRGFSTNWAISPAANTPFVFTDSRYFCSIDDELAQYIDSDILLTSTQTNPSTVVSNPQSVSHSCPFAYSDR